ncbi:alkaline-phosphatase-like protein [Trichoderma austrokoningii]
MSGAQFLSRRIMRATALRLLNRRFAFAIAATATLSAKSVHIYAHLDALQKRELLLWGLSFFSQDTACLLAIRTLVDQSLGTVLSIFITFVVLLLVITAAISESFFFTTGTELQWRNVALASDSSSWSTLSAGWIACLLSFISMFIIAGIFQYPLDQVSRCALEILRLPVSLISNKLPVLHRYSFAEETYKHLPQQDVEYIEYVYKEDELEVQGLEMDIMQPTKCKSYLRLLVGLVMVAQAISTITRPTDQSFIFMSWTLPLTPFVDIMFSTPSLADLLAMSGNVNDALHNTTALGELIHWAWLPNNESLQGFQDWYEMDKEHYNALNDPLKLSNLEEDLLMPLRANLDDVPIRHIMLVKLESTRKDVFPIKKNSYIWNSLAQSFENSSLLLKAQKKLSSLTSTAKYLTGDFSDGFGEQSGTSRGGINANNAFTTSTYTLKSLVGTHCGISPLAADFNVETDHHIYQPCLPHIFEALNQLNHSHDEESNDHFTSYKWKTTFMQSVTLRYDKQDLLMPQIGFTDPLGWWELKDEAAKFGPVDLPDINYYGMPECAVEDYLRDTFASAKKNNERVFLSHLTSSTHHEFGLPEDEEYVPLSNDPDLDDLSHYLNTVGFVDRWLNRILQILEEEGVADETLLVAVGDHGLSIAERGTITPYSNPHVANYHVPLVMSHPKLPSINIDDAVSSIQILPTILDLLLETGSLSKSEAEAVRDMVQNYEGQSLIRPLQKFSETSGQGGWQHTVMNPGGSTIAVRDARQPNWRLIVPVFGNYEWRFTNLETDPHEDVPLVSYDYKTILRIVEEQFGAEAATWVKEAAAVTRWWTDENYKRWRYTA